MVMATHPDSECPANVSKKYVRFGASPRAAQALISAAKVRALINGRYNVSYNDLNALAGPVLRHRIKPNFEAITERITTDKIIEEIIKELGHGTNGSHKDSSVKKVQVTTDEPQNPVTPEGSNETKSKSKRVWK
jgi:Mg-chelatase subunit ChlI